MWFEVQFYRPICNEFTGRWLSLWLWAWDEVEAEKLIQEAFPWANQVQCMGGTYSEPKGVCTLKLKQQDE